MCQLLCWCQKEHTVDLDAKPGVQQMLRLQRKGSDAPRWLFRLSNSEPSTSELESSVSLQRFDWTTDSLYLWRSSCPRSRESGRMNIVYRYVLRVWQAVASSEWSAGLGVTVGVSGWLSSSQDSFADQWQVSDHSCAFLFKCPVFQHRCAQTGVDSCS